MEPLDPRLLGDLELAVMVPWRITGAVALSSAFVLIGWEVQRVVDGQPWLASSMWASMLCAVVAATSVLGWTWNTVSNARRLVEPALNRDLPDPKRAVAMWFVPFGFVAAALAVVAFLAVQVNTGADDTVSSLPLAVGVIALLIAIPMTYRPLHYLAGVVRQVGGHSSNLSQWMWVPVVLAIVGVASIAAIRLGGVSEGDDVSDASQWVPLWVVGVVAIAPCVIVVLLAWRASTSVEEAIRLAADRRVRAPGAGAKRSAPKRGSAGSRLDVAAFAARRRVRLLPGSDLLRFCIVSLLSVLALLTMVAAAVALLFWTESEDGVLLAGRRARAWEALDVLHTGARHVLVGLLALTSMWSLIAVSNVRMASTRRRNPILAAAAWPAAAFGLWAVADRFVVDQTVGMIVLGFVGQAAILYAPFHLVRRAGDAVGARRTPLAFTYTIGVVLLVYVQAGLSAIDETNDSDFGRLAVFLSIGAIIQLFSALAVTEACRSLDAATIREADRVNVLVDQRDAAAKRTAAVEGFGAATDRAEVVTTAAGPP